MTNEEMQRAKEFIVEQQAQFAASIQRLDEERGRDNKRLTRVEESFQLLVRLVQTAETRLDRLEVSSTSHEINQTRFETNMTVLESKMVALAEGLQELIDIVRRGKNGTAN